MDDEDYEYLSQFQWHAHPASGVKSRRFYAVRVVQKNYVKHNILMHRVILNCPGSIDHRDHDGLNNQRSNIRPCTRSQNLANSVRQVRGSSKWVGVYQEKSQKNRVKKWRAAIQKDKKVISIGYFKHEHNAATAYNFVSDELFGEFAFFNLPQG